MKLIGKVFSVLARASAISMLKEQAGFIKQVSDNTLKLDAAHSGKVTFEMLPSMGVSEKKIQSAKRAFYVLTWLFLLGSGLILIYFLYLLIMSYWLTALICFLVLIAFLANAVKFHFWYYQINQRKLGCTMSEWFQYLIKYGPFK